MMSEREAVIVLHPEHTHRKPSHRASDPIAIKVKRCPVGRADIGGDIHFHAVDDGEEIPALEIEFAHCLRQAEKVLRRRAEIKRVKVGTPLLKLLAAQIARAGIIGDVIDRAAERIDLEHRLALGAGQNAHSLVERTARSTFGRW